MATHPQRYGLAETAAIYGTERAGASHRKLSISLPVDLVDHVQAAAAESGLGMSGVIAAALRGAIASADRERLERALELDAEDNERWANDALALTARAWADLKW